jgi:hypothetical protein
MLTMIEADFRVKGLDTTARTDGSFNIDISILENPTAKPALHVKYFAGRTIL